MVPNHRLPSKTWIILVIVYFSVGFKSKMVEVGSWGGGILDEQEPQFALILNWAQSKEALAEIRNILKSKVQHYSQ